MNFYSKIILSATFSLVAAISATAQNNDVDLSSQRSELQILKTIPGEKLDHSNGVIVNPTPQNMTVHPNKLYIGDGIKVVDRKKAFRYDLDFLPNKKGKCKLVIDFGEKKAKKMGVKEAPGAYAMTINENDINITGYDELGAFYGIQTLRQLYESPSSAQGTTLPFIEINDYPDLPYRGVVEGFYGTPWSHQVRLSLIDFYGRNKMNNYIYGPKDDPYHSSPNWRLPYPPKEAQNIHELVEACKRNRVNFVWAIHPGADIRWNEADYDSLVSKFNMMYDLGVRAFAIFFDDISGEGAKPSKQVELLNRLNADFVKSKGDVANLMVCPTDYTKLWANPSPQGALAVYGNTLDPSIEVFWTGDVVCSDLTPSTLEFVNSRIKRPALYWWNFPVSDYCRNFILQGPVYGLDTSLTANEVAGFESNPMEHGEASKLALYGVADYTWNISDYNPIDNWERGLQLLVPDASDAYRTFAIHSCDTQTGYRRDESWETPTFEYNNYTMPQFNALKAEFKKITEVPAKMEAGCKNKNLLNELRPWLTEFGKLGKRGLRTLDLIDLFEEEKDSAFWCNYLANIMTPDEAKAYEAHKSGTLKLQPFYTNAMSGMLTDFYKRITGVNPLISKGIGSYRNASTQAANDMLDGNPSTFYHSGAGQGKNHWIGVDIGDVTPICEIRILQGRNSVDDADIYDNAVVETSVDGKNWSALTQPLVKQYEINWSGAPIEARYVRLKRLDSALTTWLAIREFSINSSSQNSDAPSVTGSGAAEAAKAFDRNTLTTANISGEISFIRPENAESLTMLLGPGDNALTVTLLDGNGKALSSKNVNGSYADIKLTPDTKSIRLSGNAVIHEIMTKQIR